MTLGIFKQYWPRWPLAQGLSQPGVTWSTSPDADLFCGEHAHSKVCMCKCLVSFDMDVIKKALPEGCWQHGNVVWRM